MIKHIIIFCLLILPSGLFGQGVRLINADVQRGQTIGGEEVVILEGDVHVVQDTLDLQCQHLMFFRRQDKLVLTGDVQLIRGAGTLEADKVTYYNRTSFAICEDNVVVTQPGQRLTCDYLEYYYKTDQALARGNLFIHDEENQAWITGGKGKYVPGNRRFEVEENAHFWQVENADTINIFAEMMTYGVDSVRSALARDSVRIVSGDMIATCDSAVYFPESETAFLEISPKASQTNNEMFGTQMELMFIENRIRQIWVRGDANAVSVDDSSAGKVNRLTGQSIIGYIEQQKLRELKAISNARSQYYINDEGVDQGFNAASADTIRIFFAEQVLDSIAVQGGAQGTYYPSDYKGKVKVE